MMSKFQQLATKFEHYCVHILTEDNQTQTKWYHWDRVPHEVLFDSGYIHNYHQHRKRMLQSFKDGITLRDVGVDFIGQTDDYFIFGQSKLYESNVTYSDASTWLSKTVISRQHNPLNSGILCTVNGISLELQGDIQYAGLTHRKLDIHQFEQWNITQNIPRTVFREVELVRRDYQVSTVNQSVEYLKQNERAKLVIQMCCGLGKTLILGDILKEITPRCIIMMAPFKTDVQNLHARIPDLIRPKYELVLFDSDESADINVLVDKIKMCITKKKKLLIFTTFKSCGDKIANYIYPDEEYEEMEEYIGDTDEEHTDTEDEEDIEEYTDEDEDEEEEVVSFLQQATIIVDECHELSVSNKTLLQFINDAKQSIFTTATLPKAFKKYIPYDLCIDEYDFKYALSNNYIVDYRIMIPMKCEDAELDSFANTTISQKASFLMKGMLQSGSRRCIVYLSTKEDCITFANEWKRVGNGYFGIKTEAFRINDDTTYVQRKKTIQSFEDTNDDCISVLVNCRCLNQAVDIPKCDSTFITNISDTSSEIVMFQRFLRPSRLDIHNKEKINHCFLWIDDNNTSSLEVCLTKLKSGLGDKCFDKKVKVIAQSYDIQCEQSVKEKIDTIQQDVNLKLVEWVDADLRWNRRLEEAGKFILANKRRPSKRSDNNYEKTLGLWIRTQITNYNKKHNSMSVIERQTMWENFAEIHKQYLLNIDEVWENNFKEVHEFIIKYNRRPSTDGKDISIHEKQLASWLQHQITNYKKKQRSMALNERQTMWENFVETHKQYFLNNDEVWETTFKEVHEFITKYKRRPVEKGKNSSIREKQLAQWVQDQLKNYKKQQKSMSTNERQTVWKNFIETHKQYFLNNDEVWETTFKEVHEFITKYKRRPSNGKNSSIREKQLASWLQHQITNYKKKQQGMAFIERQTMWENFTETYKQYFK